MSKVIKKELPVISPPAEVKLDKEILEQIHKLLISIAVYPCPKNPLRDAENDEDYRKFAKARDWVRYELYKLMTTKEG